LSHSGDNAAMNSPDNSSPRQRLKALLAIPDSQRSEAQWDEIVELEIMLAPGNREDGPRLLPQREKSHVAGTPQKSNSAGQGRRPPRRFKKRPKTETT
jgi:hypothetical protein